MNSDQQTPSAAGDDEPRVDPESGATPASRSHGEGGPRYTTVLAVVGTVVAALLSAMGGFLGALWAADTQADGALAVQREQNQAQLDQQWREKTGQVYLEFLDAANRYSADVAQVKPCLLQVGTPPQVVVRSGAECARAVTDLAPSRYAFQGARNKVFLFGSDEAERVARTIAAYLPPAVDGDPISGLPPIDLDILDYDPARFNELYRQFNRVACREIPPPSSQRSCV